MTKRTCSEDECDRPGEYRSMCNMHYKRAKKAGMLPPRKTIADRFWEKVDKTNSCWIWTAAKRAGYGKFAPSTGRQVTAHRYVLELAGTVVSEDMDVDHVCGNRACVNPDHLRVTTRKQNLENMTVLHGRNTSGYRGVSARRGGFMAYVNHHGHHYHVGDFETAEEAAEAARLKRNELFTHNNRDRAA